MLVPYLQPHQDESYDSTNRHLCTVVRILLKIRMWPTRQTRDSSHWRLLSETTRRAHMPSDHQARHLNCPASFIDTLAGVFGPPRWSGHDIHWSSAAGLVKATVLASDALTTDGRQLQGAIKVVQELRLASPELAQAI